MARHNSGRHGSTGPVGARAAGVAEACAACGAFPVSNSKCLTMAAKVSAPDLPSTTWVNPDDKAFVQPIIKL